MSKVSSLTAQSLGQLDQPSKSGIMDPKFSNCNDSTVKERLKVGILSSDHKYGLGRGLYAAKLLLHLLLIRNAHRKRLYDYITPGIMGNNDILDDLLLTDDMEITGIYIIGDQEYNYATDNENELIGCKIQVKRLYVRNPLLLEQIDNESLEAGSYCRNLEAIYLIKNIPVDLVLVANCLEDVALGSLCHSMLGLGGGSIIRNQYLQPLISNDVTSCGYRKVLFIGRPFRDLTAKEIYLLARHENLVSNVAYNSSIRYLYQMEFLLDIGEKHPNSLKNIAKLTAGSNINCTMVNVCAICKFVSNRDNGDICSACLEISNISEKAKSYLHSLI
ncbi:hypothetical protein BmR1_04g09496 [Babesia microti strain RI]|uniref:Uncharacterized protein n=1 Tax=Babesia microti (strain RI) TaxID=1133968 RepID=A0A1N6LYE2_BABMR|nr:hypothetical protein BmR1_04g09496 [Babesia microti strain RI]SIO73898.1 hypothetical protein BmR1_04g09496 [Babesia microti strain RI]|eukprot:XP_021337948.1 hypothetical protein BmR1_04g09496 [Babesia microti strain RI]